MILFLMHDILSSCDLVQSICGDTEFIGGGVYSVIITRYNSNVSQCTLHMFVPDTVIYLAISSFLQFQATIVKTSEPNSISILAQIPMYALITAGEIMFSITGLQFAYSQVSTSGVHNDCKHSVILIL